MGNSSDNADIGGIVDTCYFTFDDVVRSFALVTSQDEAARLAAIWWDAFPDCTNGQFFVALPESFGYPRLGAASPKDDDLTTGDEWNEASKQSPVGPDLLRFGDTTLMMMAAANPAVRSRFDRLKVHYAFRTIDTPELWQQFLAGFPKR